MSDDHISATCNVPGPTHNRSATRQNMMGGTTKGMHITIVPEQCGQVAKRDPQLSLSQGYVLWKASGFQGTQGQHKSQFRG